MKEESIKLNKVNTRRNSRIKSIQLIYSLNFNSTDSSLTQELLNLNQDLYSKEIIQIFIENQLEIDTMITHLLKNWKFNRLSKVDTSMMRLGIVEILFKKIDKKIIINEYIEISKTFSSIESFKFINAILANIPN